MESVCLELSGISKYYVSGRNVTAALKNVTLAFRTGEFVAITGESGSGKSTMAHVMAGIIPFESGELYINGEASSQYSEAQWEDYRRDKISFVAQNYGVLPGNTVLDNVVSALKLAGADTEEAKKRAKELLGRVDLWKQRKRRAARLSSGQKQRLSIARALAKDAPILIADEPTGNLDPENSMKVIRLLAEAAEKKLVIMITHDFKAAADEVTRRVAIHDGSVQQDVILKETTAQEKTEESGLQETAAKDHPEPQTVQRDHLEQKTEPGKKSGIARLGIYVAGLQLRARPAWTGFMAVFFALTAFAVFAFLGTFIIALDDTSTRLYSNEAFLNGDERRLVVSKRDGTGFTGEDAEKIIGLSWAESLERYDAAADVNYYYRDGIDYGYRYIQVYGTDVQVGQEVVRETVMLNHSCYVRTVPVLKEGKTFLTAGRLPEHMDEVVAAGDESLIGTELPVYFLDRKKWGADAYVLRTVKVVGVTDYGSGLYFDDRIGQMLNQSVCLDYWILGVNDTLTGSDYWVTDQLLQKTSYKNQVLRLWSMNDPEEYMDIIPTWETVNFDSNNPYYIELSEEVFDRYVYQGESTQVSLFLKDYSYTDRAIRALSDMGYDAVSPYRVSSVMVDPVKANERMTTLVLCMVALIVVVAAQITVLSSMFGLEMGSYAQLSDLGLSCRTGKLSVLCQVLLLTVIGQALGISLAALGASHGVERLYNVMKYLEPIHLAGICGLHLAASLLVAAAAGYMLRRQVFPYLRENSDVDLAELDEEARR